MEAPFQLIFKSNKNISLATIILLELSMEGLSSSMG